MSTMTSRTPLFNSRTRQGGLSLVEMMVGIAVGLIVVAGAALLVSSQLGENRRLLLETQLQQDMRAAMDIMSRELRRMGAQREPVALLGLASPGGAQENSMARLSPTVGGETVDSLEFHYQPTLGNDDFGFKLDSGVVKSKLGASGWQELTDFNVMKVTKLEFTPTHRELGRLPCPKPCPDVASPTGCWPEVRVRYIDVKLEAEAKSDTNVKRTLTSRVRVRNDVIQFNVSPAEICPS